MGAGETRLVKVTFPANYGNDKLAGKAAEFDVIAKSIEAPGTVTIDEAFAKSLGLDSLDKLKEAVKGRLQQEHAGLTRQRLKRQLLDKLDEMHKFGLPPTLAEDEFKSVWNAVESDLKAQAALPTKARPGEGAHRAIAERRVRLGLVLAEIGEKNKITVTEDELRAPSSSAPDRYQDANRKSGVLPEESGGGRGDQGTDLRGEGGRLPGGTRRGDGEAGRA